MHCVITKATAAVLTRQAGVLLGVVPGARSHLIEDTRVGGCAVGGDLDGVSVVVFNARVTNQRAAARSRFSETSTSMTCPN